MPSIDELKKKYPGSAYDTMTPLEIVDHIAKQSGRALDAVAYDYGVQLPNKAGAGTAFKNSLYSTAQGLGQLAGDFIPGVDNNNALELYGRAGVQRNPVDIMDGDGGAFANLASNLTERPLNVIGQIGGSALGLIAPGGAAKVGLNAYRGMRGLGALGTGGRIAAGAADTTLYSLPSYGNMRDSQEELGQNDLFDELKAIGAAATIGQIEKGFGLESALAGKGVTGQTFRGTLARQMAGEAGEEMLQAPVEQYGSGKEVFSKETLDQMLAGSLAGAIGGGLAAPIVQFASKKPLSDTEPTNLFDDEVSPTQDPLAIEYKPDPVISFPDGSTGTQKQLDAYLNSLPEQERVAARAKLFGYGEKPTTESMLGIQSDGPLMLGYRGQDVNPAGGNLVSFPDGSTGTVEQVEQYLSQFPESQRTAVRAQLLGVGQTPTTETMLGLQSGGPLMLGYRGQDVNPAGGNLFTFPDGSTGTQEQIEQYIASLPEEQQVAARAKLLGMGQTRARIDPNQVNDVTPMLQNTLYGTDTGTVMGRPLTEQESQYKAILNQQKQQQAAANAQDEASVELYNNILGTNNTLKNFPAKRLELMREINKLVSEGTVASDDVIGIVGRLAKSDYPSAQIKLNELKATLNPQPAQQTGEAMPEVPAVENQNVETAVKYKQDMQRFLTQDLSPEEVQTLAEVRGMLQAQEDGTEDVEQSSYSAVGKKLGISKQAVAKRIANAQQKIETRASASGIDLNRAMVLLDMPEAAQYQNDQQISEAQAAQEGLTYRSGNRANRAPSDDFVDYTETGDSVTDTDTEGVILDEDESNADDTEFDPTLTAEDVENAQDIWPDIYEEAVVEGRRIPPLAGLTKKELSDFALALRQASRETSQSRFIKTIQDAVSAIENGRKNDGRRTVARLGGDVEGKQRQAEPKTTGKMGTAAEAQTDVGLRGTASQAETAPAKRTPAEIVKELKGRRANPIARDYLARVTNGEDVEVEVNAWLDAVAADEKTLKSKGTALPNFGRGYVDVREALKTFDDAGLGGIFSLLDSVEDTDLGADTNGLFVALPNGMFKVQLNRKVLDAKTPADRAHVVRHEVSHGVDYATDWSLSRHPWMEFEVEVDGSITPIGEAAQEIYDHYVDGGAMSDYLGYPLNRTENSELDKNYTQAEVFAQIASQWLTPQGKQFISKNLPKTAAFMKEAFKYASSTIQKGSTDGRGKGQSQQAEKIATSKDVQSKEKRLASKGGAFEIRPEAKGWLDDFVYRIKDLTPKWLTGTQLVEQWGDRIKALVTHQNILDKTAAEETRLRKAGHKLLEKWGTYAFRSAKDNLKLMDVMSKATQWGIHPDLYLSHPDNAHLSASDKVKYAQLSAAYKALDPTAKAIYQDAKKVLADTWSERKSVWKNLVDTSFKDRIAEAEKAGDAKLVNALKEKQAKEIADYEKAFKDLKGPYFPQMRFGDNILVAESAELLKLRDEVETATGPKRAELLKQLEKMEADEKHYVVQAFERRSELDAERAKLEARGLQTREKKGEAYSREFRPLTANAEARINQMINSQFDGSTATKMKAIVTEMYLASTPERHALQRQIKRKGVAGASTDMLRAFAEAVERDSHYLARLKYNRELSQNMYTMQKETSAMGIDESNVYNTILARTESDMDYRPTPVISMLARVSSFFHLGVSPAYLLTNMTQPWFITLPQLAGKFGMSGSTAAMRKAWGDAVGIIKQAKGGDLMNLADIDLSKIKNPSERKLLEYLRDRNKLDADILLDMANLADGIDPRLLKAQKAFGWATHHIELVNRISTALATYRLEKSRNPGMSEQELIESAMNMVDLTQLDYSAQNTALLMKPTAGLGSINKLIFQFRKYQQGMLYLLGRNAKLAWGGDKEAMRSLGYLMGMQVTFAGLVGVPLTTPILAAANLLLDDDDEEGDAEARMRNYLADMIGEDAARAFYKGLPTAMGVDVSGNVGMGNLLKPFPMMSGRDVTDARTGKDVVSDVLLNAAGAPVGMIANMVDGAILAGDGEVYKGLSRMAPRFIGSMIKAAELADDGLTTRTGKEVLGADEFDGWDVMFRAMGFNPTKVSERYSAQAAKDDVSSEIQDRRKEILRDYMKARNGDADMAEVTDAIAEFNLDHPTNPINRSTLLRAMKKGKGDVDEAGVSFNKNEASLRPIDRFAK